MIYIEFGVYEQAQQVSTHLRIFACWGAGVRWTPLPQAEAPTEATAEKIPNPLNLKKGEQNGREKKSNSAKAMGR